MTEETFVSKAKRRVKAYAAFAGLTRYQLAYKLGDRDLNGFDTPGWNPKANTLEKLEQLVPPEFDEKVAPRRKRSAAA